MEDLDVDLIDHSLNEPINSDNEDYIMQVIPRDYLSDSTVTLHLIGQYGAENLGWDEQRFIKRELQASLYHAVGNTQNWILGIVLPAMYDTVYTGSTTCARCGNGHQLVRIDDRTVVSEFSYNYYIPHNRCSRQEEDRFCLLVKWDNFVTTPELFLEQAFQKRFDPIAEKTRVRP